MWNNIQWQLMQKYLHMYNIYFSGTAMTYGYMEYGQACACSEIARSCPQKAGPCILIEQSIFGISLAMPLIYLHPMTTVVQCTYCTQICIRSYMFY